MVAPRGCAFVVMERRRDAAKALAKRDKHKLHTKEITVRWAPGKGVKGREWKDYWESDLGVSYLPWDALHARWTMGALSLDALEDGGSVDEETLPPWLPPRVMSKPMLDNMPMMGMPSMAGLPPNMAGMPPSMAGMPHSMAGMPPNLANIPLPGAMGSAPNMSMPVRLPPPGMRGLAAGLPPGIRPPNIPTGVPGLQGEAGMTPAGALLGFPPGMPPQPGMVGGYLGVGSLLGGVLGGVGLGGAGLGGAGLGGAGLGAGLLGAMPNVPRSVPDHPLQHTNRPAEVVSTDDAMDLDSEDQHDVDKPDTSKAPPLSSDIQALISKPPPHFNASEPPPNFNSETFNEDKDDRRERDRDRRDRERDRDRRDRGRDDRRDRDRGENRDRENRGEKVDGRERDNRERGENRERGDRRDRDRGGRDRERDERRDRDRDNRERDRGRERRDRDRDRERDRPPRDNNNRERSREKSEQMGANPEPSSEKTLQERLWEMANGKPQSSRDNDKPAADYDRNERQDDDVGRSERNERAPASTSEPEGDKLPEVESGWTQLPPPTSMAPAFRAELRMRGPSRPQMRGPWPEMGGPPPFGLRFNGMGPPPFNRPPFERPPFEGGPMFDGPPRFERPPFNRMPFDPMMRPPFDGPRPPFDGSRPPFDGMRPPFDGPRPPFDGPRPPFDGPRPPFDGPRPPFDGSRNFDGERPPRFDGPPEFFDRNNRRFDDREQFNERWNGDREREWDRRNEWDDRRRDRRRDDDNRDRFNNRDRQVDSRERHDNRDDRHEKDKVTERDWDDWGGVEDNDVNEKRSDEKPKKEERPRRDKDRKSRWGAADDTVPQQEMSEPISEEAQTSENVTTGLESSGQDTNQAENQIENPMEVEEYSSEVQNNFDQSNESVNDDHVESVTQMEDFQTNADDAPFKGDVSESNTNDNSVSNDNYSEEMRENEDEPSQGFAGFSKSDDSNNEFLETKENESIDKFEPSSDEPTQNVVIPDLYDTNDALDTSFSIQAPEDPPPPVVEKEPLIDAPESTKSDDIFGQEPVKESNVEAEGTA